MKPTLKLIEYVILVDKANNVIGDIERSIMRAKNLIHRSSFIFIINSKYFLLRKELFVQLRTATKDYCPSFYDLATGGVVKKGESDEE